MARLFSQKAFAEIVGASESTIRRWIKDGMPAEKGRTKAGYKIDSARAINWMEKRAVEKATGGEAKTYDSERLRLIEQQADAAQLENDAKRGILVYADEVLEFHQKMAAETANHLKGMGARVCQEAAADGTPGGIKAIVDKEAVRIRNALSDSAAGCAESLRAGGGIRIDS